MKKNRLLILLSSFALVGCEFDAGLIKLVSKDVEEQNNEQLIEDENQKTTGNPVENDQTATNPPTTTDPEIGDDPIIGQYTVTISFCGSEFSSVTSGQAGYVFSDHPDVLQNYCASKLDATNMLSNIEFSNLNTAMYQDVLYLSIGTGYYGNDKFKEGLFKWTSPLPMHKVEIKAKAYSKLGGGGSTDIKSTVWIDDKSCSLACASDADPISQTLSIDYENGTQSFSIKSTGSRVMLEELKITWSYIYGA